MSRSFLIIPTAMIVIFLATAATVAAQGHGHHNGVTIRIGPPVQFGPPTSFIGRGPTPVAPFVAPPFAFAPPAQTIIVPQTFGYYSPFIWPAPIYAMPAYSVPAYTPPPPQPPSPSQNEIDLAYQVRRLSREIERLREEQGARSFAQPLPAKPSTPEKPSVPTVLVFRDGHRTEIQNYAIVGQTLWVLDENTSTKISISDLDLDATQKENRNRGVRFP